MVLDGNPRDETFAVQTNPDTRAPDPVGQGVLLGAGYYYPDPSP